MRSTDSTSWNTTVKHFTFESIRNKNNALNVPLQMHESNGSTLSNSIAHQSIQPAPANLKTHSHSLYINQLNDIVPCVSVNRSCLGTCSAWEQNTTGESNSAAVNTVQNIISLWTEPKLATAFTGVFLLLFFYFTSQLYTSWKSVGCCVIQHMQTGSRILVCGLHKSWSEYLIEKCSGKYCRIWTCVVF